MAAKSRTFNVPAYLAAVAAGSFVAACFLILATSSEFADLTPNAFWYGPLVGIAVGFLPSLLIFLPATLVSLWVANRQGWDSLLVDALMGAAAALATSVCIALVWTVVAEWSIDLRLVAALVAMAVSGAVAGAAYGGVSRLSAPKEQRYVD